MDGLGTRHNIAFLCDKTIPSPCILTCWNCMGLWAASGNTCTLPWKAQPAWLCNVQVEIRLLVLSLCWRIVQTILVLIDIGHAMSCPRTCTHGWEQCLSCPFSLLVLLPVYLAAGPDHPYPVLVSSLLLCLASVASSWSWDTGSVSVVSESRPRACVSSFFKSCWASPALLWMTAVNGWDREENQDSTVQVICSSCQK